MSSKSLKDRMEFYRKLSDAHIMPRLPLIITVNGRSFSKLTSFLDKPYCPKLSECLLSTTLRLCSEIEGAVFAYQHNDEITVVARNDQNPDTNPWYDNNVQKLCSITSAIATLHFSECAKNVDLNLSGQPLFTAHVFGVPSLSEAINAVIYRQQHNFQTSIQFTCLYELLKTHDKNSIREMLNGLNLDEKIDLLKQECGVDFNQLPVAFRRGVGCYKVPLLVNGALKNQWKLDVELPIFTKEQSFLTNLFRMGADIFNGKENE